MNQLNKNLISITKSLGEALKMLNSLSNDKILFVIGTNNRFIGSITDGDIRRGLMVSKSLKIKLDSIVRKKAKYLRKEDKNIQKLIELRDKGYKIFPVLDNQERVVEIINFNTKKSYLPIDVIVMAGGMGKRLYPMTFKTPKPLLEIGGKPIIKYSIDSLINYGVENFWISINYLAEQVEEYFNAKKSEIVKYNFIKESKPLGTIGSASIIKDFKNDYVMVVNCDVLTNLNFEEFFLDFKKNDAAMSVVTIPYRTTIPYGVIKSKGNLISDLTEKPSYTYYSNAGIYLIKKKYLKKIPEGKKFNATQLLMLLVKSNKKVISYPFSGYWLDIGKPEDYNRAINDVNRIKI